MWGKSSQTLSLVDSARTAGLNISLDQYPYDASYTGISVLIPSWARAGVGAPSSGVGDVPPSTGFTFGAKGDFVTRNFGALPGLGGSPVFGVNFREGIGGV